MPVIPKLHGKYVPSVETKTSRVHETGPASGMVLGTVVAAVVAAIAPTIQRYVTADLGFDAAG